MSDKKNKSEIQNEKVKDSGESIEEKHDSRSLVNNSNKTNSKTVLVGMTGGVDSTVAAFLLKKQGYKVIGLGVTLFDKHDEYFYKKPRVDLDDEYESSSKENKVDENYLDKILPHCYVEDLKTIKEVCNKIEIPFYAVNSNNIYREKVLNRAVNSKIVGQTFSPCHSCHEIILKALHDKLDQLNASFIATGHYAKLLFSKKHKLYQLYSSNDVVNDQSFLLTKVDQKIFAKTIFPLSDMKKDEVKKIAMAMQFNIQKEKKHMKCFMNIPQFSELINRVTPQSLRPSGTIVKLKDEIFLGDHKGVHYFHAGQNLDPNQLNVMDNHLSVLSIDPISRNVTVTSTVNLKFKKFKIKDFINSFHSDISKPIKAFVKIGHQESLLTCEIFFKGLNTAIIELDKEIEGVFNSGESAVFYFKPTAVSKVLGRGTIQHIDEFQEAFIQLKKEQQIIEDEDEGENQEDDFLF